MATLEQLSIEELRAKVKATSGKLAEEKENALYVHRLASALVECGDLNGASSVIQKLQVETVSSLSPSEVVAYLLDQVDIVLQQHDDLRTKLVLKRIKWGMVAGANMRRYATRLLRYQLQVFRAEGDWLSIAANSCSLAQSTEKKLSVTQTGEMNEPLPSKEEIDTVTGEAWGLAMVALLLSAPATEVGRFNELRDLIMTNTSASTGVRLPAFTQRLRPILENSGRVCTADVDLITKEVSNSGIALGLQSPPPLCKVGASDIIEPLMSTPEDVQLFRTRLIQRNILAISRYCTSIYMGRVAALCGPGAGVSTDDVDSAVVSLHREVSHVRDADTSGKARNGVCVPRIDAVDMVLKFQHSQSAPAQSVYYWTKSFEDIVTKIELASQAVESLDA